MSTSGDSTFNPAVTFIVRQALLQVSAIMEDETPTPGMYDDGVFQLNGFVMGLQMTGLHVWTEEEAILFPQLGQVRYILSGTSTDHICDAYSYVQGQLDVGAAQGATTVTLQTALGISAGDNFGVQLANGPAFWTTVVGAPSGDTVTLAAPLPYAAAQGAWTWDYPPSAAVGRALKVPKARRLLWNGLGPSQNEIPLDVWSRQQYMDQPNKLTPGTFTAFFYAPKLGFGEMNLWAAPTDVNSACRFTWYRPLQDFLAPNNTMDFPQEWVNPLLWGLAREIMPAYDVPPARAVLIEKMADRYLDAATSWDRESEDIQFGLVNEGRR